MIADRPPLLDVHAHFLTDRYVEEATAAGHEHPDGMPAWPRWDEEQQLADMDRRGVRTAVLSVSSPGVHFGDAGAAHALARHVNDEGAAAVRRHPDRLALLASLPLPEVAAATEEARRSLDELGAVGVILESNAAGQYLGDPALDPLWAELDARGAVVLVHPTSPPGWEATALGRPRPMVEFLFDSTRSVLDLVLADVLDRHPAMQVVVPHTGALVPLLADRVALFLAAAHERAAVRRAMSVLWFDTAGTPLPNALAALVRIADADRIVYGSDSCWTPSDVVDRQLAALDATPAVEDDTTWRSLLSANSPRLLHRLAPVGATAAGAPRRTPERKGERE